MTSIRNESDKKKIRELVQKKIREIKDYSPRVGVFGVTGVGKSSLCNALFGKKLAAVSDVEACTREAQEITIGGESSEQGITLIDVPGVGETIERDKEYFELYKNLLPTLDLVIWVIKADDRSYSVTEKAYKEILKPNIGKCPMLFVINQVDKIEPIIDEDTGMGMWDMLENKPKPEKQKNIYKKINDISSAFDIPIKYIQTTSVSRNYHLSEVMQRIIDILPNEKKYSFFREASKEIKTERMEECAEKGIWDSIKDWAGDVWEKNKEIIVEAAIGLLSAAGKKIWGFISRK